ncbi:hypothetical protein HHK36_004360 [Tetracentron sinense]|uniref:DIS3-like exonuclease 2 n=1 Tax=Tetracentron sinense TaxID=13715 RepID=A0A834ZZU1_TETSI|nr:hypothetical protein HHK36_004360 [Tetracentron sinense]
MSDDNADKADDGIQISVQRTEDVDKEKKKKRRPNRRSKQNPSVLGAGHSSVNKIHGDASECLGNGSSSDYVSLSMNTSSSKQFGLEVHASDDHGLTRASNVAFNSLPTMHVTGVAASVEVGSMQGQHVFPSDLDEKLFSKSCPEKICREVASGSFLNKEFLHSHQSEGCDMQRKYFAPHWSVEAVNEALKKGGAFKSSFRVNAHNRLEAYCTIDGVPTDVLISGVAAQNRAVAGLHLGDPLSSLVEGDIVAVEVDPLVFWARMKESAGHYNNCNVPPKVVEVGGSCKGKDKIDVDCAYTVSRNSLLLPDRRFLQDNHFTGCSSEQNDASNSVGMICSMISSLPSKRPTGKVVAILEWSPRRNAVVGFLSVKQWISCRQGYKKNTKKNKNFMSFSNWEYIQLTPTDPKFPKMMVSVSGLPDCIKKRLEEGDATLEMELVAARIYDWGEENLLPLALVMHILGRGGEIEPQIAAILFENAICTADFSSGALSCLPTVPWAVPKEELESRRDLRNFCTFTIDPSTATDLDDALSVEKVSNDIFRVCVHIADVSYFVLPDSTLDIEAQIRSTSVYILQHKLPMLPKLLSEDLGSLIPGEDRLAFSIILDINLAGDVVDRWIGRTVIRSCCKLSYQHAQDIIDGLMDMECRSTLENGCPKLHDGFEWPDVIRCVKSLHEISKTLRENRFKDGALLLESSKLVFLFDEYGIPYDSMLCEPKDSNFLVEEFMLLANKTAAEVISRAFPNCALLRRHPEPNMRKIREFEAFCSKHGLEMDTSSSGQLHLSLGKIREHLNNDPVLFDILISYASRPMQLAVYFCTGDLEDREHDWAHYSLSVPLYTHFTSPLRRYPDIIVHRTLAAAVEAEDMYLQQRKMLQKVYRGEAVTRKLFADICFDKDAAESKEGQEALLAAALKHRVLSTEILGDVAAYCNKRKLASRHAEIAGGKVYLWALLKKKEILISEARVLGLGPKFMSIYIHKLAIERRINYDEVKGLTAEWLETTSTLVLDLRMNKRSQRRGSPGRCRTLEDVAWVISPCDLNQKLVENTHEGKATEIVGATGVELKEPEPIYMPDNSDGEIDPAVFPLTVRLFSTISVALHAVGGDGGPLDIVARLYMSSYFQ